jgi:hypothetical protein
MSKWLMRGHFGHLHFKIFPMISRTPQCKVFWPLQSSSEFSGVPEDSKSPALGVWVSSSHLAKVGLRQSRAFVFSLGSWGFLLMFLERLKVFAFILRGWRFLFLFLERLKAFVFVLGGWRFLCLFLKRLKAFVFVLEGLKVLMFVLKEVEDFVFGLREVKGKSLWS